MDEIKKEEQGVHQEKNSNERQEKKIKNLISVAILLAGLLLGSLFVDIAQIVRGTGYSAKNLNKAEIFESQGKTWVAYSEPAVPVAIINDDACENCDVTEVLVWLRRVLPTVSTEKVAYDSERGKEMIEKFSIKSLPAFVFSSDVEKTDFYSQAAIIFNKKDDSLVLNTSQLGMPVGKFVELPQVEEGTVSIGSTDSKVKVVVYSDYECPYCKILYQSLREVMKQYNENVMFAYKHLPLTDIHPQAMNASMAADCSREQNKFWEYSDKLYNSQTEWAKTKDVAKFKEYARFLGLNANEFNKCLDEKKYQEKINREKKEAEDFGLSGTPAVFVNDKFENGALTTEQLKTMIEEQLNK